MAVKLKSGSPLADQGGGCPMGGREEGRWSRPGVPGPGNGSDCRLPGDSAPLPASNNPSVGVGATTSTNKHLVSGHARKAFIFNSFRKSIGFLPFITNSELPDFGGVIPQLFFPSLRLKVGR